MFRTTVNVFGDCVGTIVVDSMMDKEDFSKDTDKHMIDGEDIK